MNRTSKSMYRLGNATTAAGAEVVYCPHRPWPKQKLFLNLKCKEAFYGGAAAGGKSEALLMAALQYVHVPGYSAIILRTDLQRLRLAGGIIGRSHEWLTNTPATWNEVKQRWTFPTAGAPATLSFGYLRESRDKYRYGSSEYQYIAFDELTEFVEEDYLFLFSRLRKRKEIDVPLRVRSASNPGNAGHAWVLGRFISDAARKGASRRNIYWKNGIAYVPARIRDNPAIDEAEYCESLSHLPTVERERLMNGDWSVRDDSLIRPEWLARYAVHGQRLDLLDSQGQTFAQVDERDCYRFMTIDPAGTSADRAKVARGRAASWTVMQVWDMPGGKLQRQLLLRHVVRERVGFAALCHRVGEVFRAWRPQRIYVEREKLGQAVFDQFENSLPLDTIGTASQDKITRAAPLIVRLERGEIRLPRDPAPWLAALETEWLHWTGHEREPSDQIDAAAYAAIIADERQQRVIQLKGW